MKKRRNTFSNLILELNNHKSDRILSMVSENFEADLVGYGIWHGKDESSKFLSDLFQFNLYFVMTSIRHFQTIIEQKEFTNYTLSK